jgi:hypothetical protein
MPIHHSRSSRAIDPTVAPRARRLYETIRDTLGSVDTVVQLRLLSALRDGVSWRHLEAELQDLFAALAGELGE